MSSSLCQVHFTGHRTHVIKLLILFLSRETNNGYRFLDLVFTHGPLDTFIPIAALMVIIHDKVLLIAVGF